MTPSESSSKVLSSDSDCDDEIDEEELRTSWWRLRGQQGPEIDDNEEEEMDSDEMRNRLSRLRGVEGDVSECKQKHRQTAYVWKCYGHRTVSEYFEL